MVKYHSGTDRQLFKIGHTLTQTLSVYHMRKLPALLNLQLHSLSHSYFLIDCIRNSNRWAVVACRERSDILFFGITAAVAYVVQSKVRALQEEQWQRRIKDIEMRPYMMDKEKEDTVNIPFY